MYKSRPVITSVDFDSSFFDPYLRRFTPSDDSFDFIKLNALPNQFIKFIKKSTESEITKNPKYTFNAASYTTVNDFHQKILQLFMAFGLSFSDNDYINIQKLPLHNEILEMKLCIFLNNKNNDDKNEFNFFKDFNQTKSLLDKSNLSAIFIFNSPDGIIPLCVNNGNLPKSPIIVVYSEKSALILFPHDFRFFTHFISDELIGGNKNNQFGNIEDKFLTLFDYKIVDDHWIPHICKNHFYKLIASYFPHQRSDMLSFDFKSLSKNPNFNKIDLFGYIGKIDDIEEKLDITYDGLKTSVPPKLLFYKNSANLAYLIFFIPNDSPGIRKCSPASPLYIEAASHAYHYMRSCCSSVVIIPSTDKNEDEVNSFNGTINGLSTPDIEPDNKKLLLLGCYETVTNVKIFRTLPNKNNTITNQNNNSKGNEINNDLKEEIYKFNSLQHFFIWIDWILRSRSVLFALDENIFKEVKIGSSSFYSEIKGNLRFHERSQQKVSCEISGEVFALIRKYLMKIRKNTYKKDIFIISRIVAFEDGSIKIYIKGRENNSLEYITYKFYRLCESPTKTINHVYSEKYAEIKNLESNFTIINSWTLSGKGVLTLFYSDSEKKMMIIFLKIYYCDVIPPFPIFEIKSDFKKADDSKEQTMHNTNYNSLMYNSAFCPNSRNILFMIVENESPMIVSIIIDPNYTKVTKFKKNKLEDFIPLEAKNFDKVPIFSNFVINENGSNAVMFFKAVADFRRKAIPADQNIGKINIYYFYLIFDPVTLIPLKTYKIGRIDIKLPENKSFNLPNVNQILIIPLLYLKDYFLLFIHWNEKYIIALFSYKEEEANRFIGANDYSCHQNIFFFLNFRNLQTMIGVMKLMNTPYLLNLSNNDNFEVNSLFENLNNTKDQKNPFLNNRPISNQRFLMTFKGEAIGQLVLSTEQYYGTSLSDQSVIPSPKTLPLQFSNVMIDKSKDEKGLIDIKVELGNFLKIINLSQIQYLVGLIDGNNPESMFTTISPFIYLLFTAPCLVVGKAFVNAEASSTRKNSHLCYLARANNFPIFVFLRQTTKCPYFHVSVISESGSSLLNHLTGIGFSHYHVNTLAIGSRPVPHISKNFGFSDDKMKIIPENIDNLINVIGSLFTVKEATYAQAVAFISACISSDTVVLEFSEPPKLIEFFQKFFDSADIISNEFDLADYFSSPINYKDVKSAQANTKSKTKANQINVAIFCNLGNNILNTINLIYNEVDRLYEERSLNKDSISHKIFDRLILDFFQTSASSSQSAQELYKKGFLKVRESKKMTADAVISIKKMSFTFGAQVDHDANLKTNIEEYLSTPYVKRDESINGKDALYNLSNQIFNDACKFDEKTIRKAKKLCKLAADSGSNEAMYALYKKYNVSLGNDECGYLNLAAENGNIDAQLELIKNKYKSDDLKLKNNKYYIAELQKIVENGHYQRAVFELAKCFEKKGEEFFEQQDKIQETLDCFEKSLQNLETIRNIKEYQNNRKYNKLLKEIFSRSYQTVLLKSLPVYYPELALDFVESELENDYRTCIKVLKLVPMEKINRLNLLSKIFGEKE